VRRHEQEYPAGQALDVTPAAESEAGGEIHDALSVGSIHVVQINNYRDVLAEILADGVGIQEILRLYRCDLEALINCALADGYFFAGQHILVGVLLIGKIVSQRLPVVIVVLNQAEPGACLSESQRVPSVAAAAFV
jgi:hypothetical protein